MGGKPTLEPTTLALRTGSTMRAFRPVFLDHYVEIASVRALVCRLSQQPVVRAFFGEERTRSHVLASHLCALIDQQKNLIRAVCAANDDTEETHPTDTRFVCIGWKRTSVSLR